MSLNHQKIIKFLLITSENIMENKKEPFNDCYVDLIVDTSINLLNRCVNQSIEDSQIEQRSFAIFFFFFFRF